MMPKVTMLADTFDTNNGGRLIKGEVYEISDAYAEHWVKVGLAELAPEKAQTYRQKRRQEAENAEQEPAPARTSDVVGRGEDPKPGARKP